MKITGYRTLTTQFDWGRTIGDANGQLVAAVTAVPVVILETDSGLQGIGIGSHADLDRLFPAIDGEDPRSASALFDRMLAQVFKAGHAGATYGGIGTLDSAIWDLKAKAAGEPLWRLLGGHDRFVPGYASGLDIGLDDEELHAFYTDLADRSFTAGKLKGGLDLDTDLRRLQIVADALAAHTDHPGLMIDANESWQLKQAVRYVTALEQRFDLLWVEEPLPSDDIPSHRRLAEHVTTPIALGENVYTAAQFVQYFDAQAVDFVQADLGRVGGITGYLDIAAAARTRNLPMTPHFVMELSASILAAVPNIASAEMTDGGTWTDLGIVASAGRVEHGLYHPPTAPGHGLTLDRDYLRAHALAL